MATKAEIEAARAACDKAAADVQKAVETMQAAERILARRMGLWEDAYRHLSALVAGELAGVGVSQYLAARDAATRERERANRAEAERDEARRILGGCYVLSGADTDGNDPDSMTRPDKSDQRARKAMWRDFFTRRCPTKQDVINSAVGALVLRDARIADLEARVRELRAEITRLECEGTDDR